MAVRKRWKLWAGGEDSTHLIEVEDLRGGPGIELSLCDLKAAKQLPDEECTTFVFLSENEARELVALLRFSLGEISTAEVMEQVEDA